MSAFTTVVGILAAIVGFAKYIANHVFHTVTSGSSDDIKKLLTIAAAVYIGFLVFSRMVRAMYGTFVLTAKVALIGFLAEFAYSAYKGGAPAAIETTRERAQGLIDQVMHHFGGHHAEGLFNGRGLTLATIFELAKKIPLGL